MQKKILFIVLMAQAIFGTYLYAKPGDLDTSFGLNGKITTDIGSDTDKAWGVTIQNDGKIIVAGYSYNGSDYDIAIVRYNSDGSLDNSFSGDGKVTTAIGSDNDKAYGVAIQGNGKIVAVGYSYNGSNSDFATVRYNSDGSLDTSFSGDGKATTAIGSSADEA